MLNVDLVWLDPTTLLVKLNGEATMTDAEPLDKKLTAGSAQHAKLVVFDCQNLTFLASLAIGTLIHFQSGVKRLGGRVRFAALKPEIRKMMERSRLHVICEMHETVEAACRVEPAGKHPN